MLLPVEIYDSRNERMSIFKQDGIELLKSKLEKSLADMQEINAKLQELYKAIYEFYTITKQLERKEVKGGQND